MSSLSESSILSGASGSTGTAAAHQVSQSIRFNYADKALITQDSGGSFVKETTSTISMWVKRVGYISLKRMESGNMVEPFFHTMEQTT